ncbi:MAG: 50S ribosomal protein L29 [bacterium]
MKAQELQKFETAELTAKIKESQKKLVALRFSSATKQLKNFSEIDKVRKDIARMLTIIQERAYGIGPVAVTKKTTTKKSEEADTSTKDKVVEKKVVAKKKSTSAKTTTKKVVTKRKVTTNKVK